MPREKDPFWELVQVLQNGKWRCNFCNKQYKGGVTRIKAHLAGFKGFGINDCKDVNSQVRSEAQKALKGKGAAESSRGSGGDVEEDPHLPVTANEDTRGETSSGPMTSSLLLPHDSHSQSRPAQIMIPQRDPSFETQPPSHARDSDIQQPNFSNPSSSRDLTPEASTNSQRPVHAGEGEPNTEFPQEGLHQPVIANNEDAQGETSLWQSSLPLHETTLHNQSRPAQIMLALEEFLFLTVDEEPLLLTVDEEPLLLDLLNQSHAGQSWGLGPEASTNLHPVTAEERKPNTEVPQEGPHQPVTANNEDAQGENSSAPITSSPPLPETNSRNQPCPAQIMIPQRGPSFETQTPQSHARDSDIQQPNFSNPSSSRDLTPEALTDLPRPVNAGEGEPNTEAPQEGPHQPVTANRGETSSAPMTSSPPLPETNSRNQSCPTQIMVPQRGPSFETHPPQSHARDSDIQQLNFSNPSSSRDITPEASTDLPRPVNAGEGEPNTAAPQDARTDDARVDSPPGTHEHFHGNTPTRKRKLGELSSREMNELEILVKKAKRIIEEYESMVQAFREGKSLSAQVEREDDSSEEVEEILGHGRFQKGSTIQAAGCRKSSPLPATKLVGDESANKIKQICDYLMEDEISIIGVYGMGGVGKTAILVHVHNKVLSENLVDVFWINVPQVFSMYELQDKIANAVGLDNLSKDKHEKRRVCILNRHLKKKKKRCVLIIDGLWMHFNVEEVGIPIEMDHIKLVLTTRSLDVCRKMLCQKQMKIEPLNQLDARYLFSQKLCFGRELPSEVEQIARSIVDKCGGLPLGIIEVATCMRGVEEVHRWKDMLQDLEDSRMEPAVFKRLELSYINLGDPLVQQCFLHIILCFGEDIFKTNREALIESFIDQGLLGGIATRQKLHDQGNTILDKIRDACLWSDLEYKYLYVHPLIRDMALQIVTSTKSHMVKAKMGLKEIPEEEFWTDHLEKVFLQSNNIKEIPDGTSPNCPKLTRVSLNDNVFLQDIHESFFKHLKGLEVLDLSNTGIRELPDSLSYLESLEALLLRGCEELRCIPCVRKLGSLRKLDLNGCVVLEEVPEGMEMLVKLRYLDLGGTKIGRLPEGVLGKLVNLQYLAIKKMRAGEEIKLKKVEALHCSVPNVETFNACVRLLEQNSSRRYHLELDVSEEDFESDESEEVYFWGDSKRHIRVNGEIRGDGCALIPKNVQILEVKQCGGVTSLSEVGPLENLEELTIYDWENLLELGAVHFPHLEKLNIFWCSKLKHLWEEGQGFPSLRCLSIRWSEKLEGINIAAPHLESIEVYRCRKMKRVVEWEWLATRLPNLKSIKINDCEELEEIIGGPFPIGATCLLTKLEIKGCNNIKGVLLMQDALLHLPFLQAMRVENCKGIEVIIGTVPTRTHSSFPKLTELTLKDLPELKSICDGTLSCDSIEYIDIDGCPKLKRIPLQLPLLDDGLPSPPPSLRAIWINRQTWESLEWDHPLSSSSLQRLVRLRIG